MAINSEWGLGLWGALPWGGDLDSSGPPSTPLSETVSDTLSFSDAVSNSLADWLTESLTGDSITLTDSLVYSFVIQLVFSDTLVILDSFTPSYFPLTVSIIDAILVLDYQMAAFGFAIIDQLTLLDFPAETLMAFSDTISINDNLFLTIYAVAVESDTLTLSDSVSLATGSQPSLTDTISFSDSVALATPSKYNPAPIDYLMFLDTVAKFAEFFFVFTDTLSVVDSIAITHSLINPEDTLDLVDTAIVSCVFNFNYSDTLVVTDTVGIFGTCLIAISDTFSFLDAISTSSTNVVTDYTVSDSLTISDSTTVNLILVPNRGNLIFNDSLSLSDSVLITQIPCLTPYLREYLNDVVMQ